MRPVVKARSAVPTNLELEILKVVWQRGSATVREVCDDLARQRKIAYTTVLTMMGILEQKGHLTKTPGERAYVYSSAHSEQQVVGAMVQEFVDRVFNGSPRPLLEHLIANAGLSDEELEELLRRRHGNV